MVLFLPLGQIEQLSPGRPSVREGQVVLVHLNKNTFTQERKCINIKNVQPEKPVGRDSPDVAVAETKPQCKVIKNGKKILKAKFRESVPQLFA